MAGIGEAAAWTELAALWGLEAQAGDPCQAASRSGLQCFRAVGSLALIRQLGRPVLLRLHTPKAEPSFALLTGLGGDRATLLFGGDTHTVSLVGLGAIWRGEFATLWRLPAGYRGIAPGQAGPAVDWLATALARSAGAPPPGPGQMMDPALTGRVQAFQVAQGLVPDGRPGPMTLMLLNQASGVAEPRLLTGS